MNIKCAESDFKTIKMKANSKILIIEDDFASRKIIHDIFKNNGFNFIEEASNGVEGLEVTKNFIPDLIILDINMPLMDGFEYCYIIKKEPIFANTPIIVLTGLCDKEARRKIFDAGASDYLSKPFDHYEIYARSMLHLQNNLLIKELKEQGRAMQRELESAKELQIYSMPSQLDEKKLLDKYNVSVFSYFKPSNEIGGDFWSFKHIDDNNFAVYNVDFSGHGVNAALNTFRFHTIINSEEMKKISSPCEYLAGVNTRLRKILPTGSFATMFYGVVDVNSNIIQYSTASSPKAVLISHKNKKINFIDGTGFPLGILDDATYSNNESIFEKDDILILYSDAFIETETKEGGFLDEKSFADIAFDHFYDKTISQELLNGFIEDVLSKFSEDVTDDMTLSIYKRH